MKEYIEKDAAIEFVKSLIDTMSVCTSIDECLGMKSMKSRALSALHDVPAADVVEVRRAAWQSWEQDKPPFKWYSCDYCGFHALSRSNYCPNCGAKMDGGGDK